MSRLENAADVTCVAGRRSADFSSEAVARVACTDCSSQLSGIFGVNSSMNSMQTQNKKSVHVSKDREFQKRYSETPSELRWPDSDIVSFSRFGLCGGESVCNLSGTRACVTARRPT